MVETIGLKTRSGLTFTTDVAGPADGALVLLLHGFPESRHSWRAALPELAKAGYRCVAPDQRGYSPGARPDPADLSNYSFDKLVNDALEIAASDQYAFNTNQITFRIIKRTDGQPQIDAPFTQQDGTTQISPFVILHA